jgi:hypothetical protein
MGINSLFIPVTRYRMASHRPNEYIRELEMRGISTIKGKVVPVPN